MNGFFQSQFAYLPLIKFNRVLLNWVKTAHVLFIATENKDMFLESNYAWSITAKSHWRDLAPLIVGYGVFLTASKILVARVAAENVHWRILNWENWREKCSFENHGSFVLENFVTINKSITFAEVVVNVGTTYDKHAKSFWKVTDAAEVQKFMVCA